MKMADRMEKVSDEAAQRLYERRKQLIAAGGDPEGDQVRTLRDTYPSVRKDVGAWYRLLKPVLRVKEDGTVLVPKHILDFVKSKEIELREGELQL